MEPIDRDALLAAYDVAHKGPPGGARKLIEQAPTTDAVPIKAISVWLAAYAAPPKYAIDEIARTDPDRIVTADTMVKAWEYHWKNLMECGLIGEGLDADRP